jgi:hypothetical protein
VAATAAGMFALAGHARWLSLLAAALAGGIGWGVYGALTLFGRFDPVVATGAAATVIGVVAGLSRYGARVDSHVITLSGTIPLLPRLIAYRGLYHLTAQGGGGRPGHGDARAGHRPRLTVGVALGTFIARPRTARSSTVGQPDADGGQ